MALRQTGELDNYFDYPFNCLNTIFVTKLCCSTFTTSIRRSASVVLLMAGTNDICVPCNKDHLRLPTSLWDFRNHLDKLLTVIRKTFPNAVILVQDLFPRFNLQKWLDNMSNSAFLHLTCEFNSFLRLSARGHANTVLAKCYDDALCLLKTCLSKDCLHLSPGGLKDLLHF